VLYLLL